VPRSCSSSSTCGHIVTSAARASRVA
jgi:hypothetical protein